LKKATTAMPRKRGSIRQRCKYAAPRKIVDRRGQTATPQLFLAKAVAVRWPQITAGFVPIVLRVWSEV